MATRGIDIGSTWTEITAPLSMEDDVTYVVEMKGVGPTASIEAYHSDDGSVPDDNSDTQTLWSADSPTRDADRLYIKKTDRLTYLKSTVGTVRFVISEL